MAATNTMGTSNRVVTGLLGMSPALSIAGSRPRDDDSAINGGLTEIRLASSGAYPGAVDVYWAKDGGYFEKYGLDVTMTPPFLSAADLANTVIGGDADLAILLGTVVPTVRHVGRPWTIVGTTQTPIPGWDALVGVAEATSDQPSAAAYADGVNNTFAAKVK